MEKFALLFGTTFIGGLIASIFIDGAYGIFLYQIEYLMNPRIRWWHGSLPDIRYSLIIAIGCLLGYLVKMEKYALNRVLDVPQTKWLISWAILMGLISFIAVWPEKHSRTYIDFLKKLAFLFLFYKLIDTPKKFERVIWTFLVGSFYLGWVARVAGRTDGTRLEGIGPMDAIDANGFGTVLICSVPLLIFYIMCGKRYWQKLFSALFLAYIINGLILINSRGAFLGLIVAIFYYSNFLFLKGFMSFNLKIKILVGMIACVGLFFYLTDTIFWERMDTLNEVRVDDLGTGEAAHGSSRTMFWVKGIDLSFEYPLGVGAWGYVYLSPTFIPEGFLTKGVRAAHSTWIDALVEMGYVGFIIFVGFVVSNFNLSRKVRNKLLARNSEYLYYQNAAMCSAFMGYLVSCTFMDRLTAEMMFWMPVFMASFANIYYVKGYTFDGMNIGRLSEKELAPP